MEILLLINSTKLSHDRVPIREFYPQEFSNPRPSKFQKLRDSDRLIMNVEDSKLML